MSFNYNDHHWDFLEDIEAPTWVDLAVEDEHKCYDYDDEWFQNSHQYHRCSSRQLKSMFSHSGGASTDLDDDLKGSSSPKLLSSVSRSRGKDYKSKKWRKNCENPGPLKFMIEKLSMAPSKKTKPKLSFVNAKGTSRSKPSLAKSTGNPKPNLKKPISVGCFVENTSSSISDKAGESNKSTITSGGTRPRQWKSLAVSSQTYGSTSGLLSAVKITLRKSYTTRPASRVEVTRDRKSSCSKSSVGSSSYPDHYTKGRMAPSTQSKVGGTTPDSRNVNKIEPAQNGAKLSNTCKPSIVKAREGIPNSRKVGISSLPKPSHQQPIQSKNPRANALRSKTNEQDLRTGARKAVGKTKVGGPNRLACTGKENAAVGISSTEQCNGRDAAAEKRTKPSLPQKSDRRGLIAPKGKTGGRSEGKILINSIHSGHFR